MSLQVNNNSNVSPGVSDSSTTPTAGKNAAGRSITSSDQPITTVANMASQQILSQRQQAGMRRVQEAKTENLNEDMAASQASAAKYDKKSALGQWGSRVKGKLVGTGDYADKKATFAKLQNDIEYHTFKSSIPSPNHLADLNADKAQLREWQNAVLQYSPKDQAKLMSTLMAKINSPETAHGLKETFATWLQTPEVKNMKLK
ncbi:MAG: hypothetical protein LBF43_02740 [Puniceicoccales bacterium]|jgi:hypothetical protein|nr:hypothetical protein [Puniceicoccales bacterium]